MRGWIEKGWLKLGRNNRVKDRSLKAFFEDHGDEINFERADRAWIDEVIGNVKGEQSTDEQATEPALEPPDATPQDQLTGSCN